jgi:hypothetical protein
VDPISLPETRRPHQRTLVAGVSVAPDDTDADQFLKQRRAVDVPRREELHPTKDGVGLFEAALAVAQRDQPEEQAARVQ